MSSLELPLFFRLLARKTPQGASSGLYPQPRVFCKSPHHVLSFHHALQPSLSPSLGPAATFPMQFSLPVTVAWSLSRKETQRLGETRMGSVSFFRPSTKRARQNTQ